ncbi:SEL1-like repeat protein [Neisseria flavescens]|nr:SEL1-like repeat protein [Neisseria flavescens]
MVQGQGVRQDDKQAVHWYRKAAEQGWPKLNIIGFNVRQGARSPSR